MLFIHLFVYWFYFGNKFLKLAELGVLYWRLNPKNYENDEELQKIREARGYSYMVLQFSESHFCFIIF